MLDARIRLADAETGYHRARIDYAVALKNVHFEKGSLLDYNGAMLAHGESWQKAAADVARRKIVSGDMPQLNYVLSLRDKQTAEATAVEGSQDITLIPPQGPATMVADPLLSEGRQAPSSVPPLPPDPSVVPDSTASDQSQATRAPETTQR